MYLVFNSHGRRSNEAFRLDVDRNGSTVGLVTVESCHEKFVEVCWLGKLVGVGTVGEQETQGHVSRVGMQCIGWNHWLDDAQWKRSVCV